MVNEKNAGDCAPCRAMKTMGLAILAAANRPAMKYSMERAVDLILDNRCKVVVTGLGKSGLVARKIAATLTATGQPAVYLHPVDALHGDIGMLNKDDILLVVSRSGATPELLRLLDHIAQSQMTNYRIGIIGDTGSILAKRMDVLLDASVGCEADPHNLVPTASTAVAMALGDALACALMAARPVKAEDIRRLHPAGNGSDKP